MTDNHYKATLTQGEVVWLLRTLGLTAQQGSPLLALVGVEADANEASLQDRGIDDPAWRGAFSALAAPDRQIRTIIPGPAETLIQVFYGSRLQPDAQLVGCWLEGDHLLVTFPWEEEDVVAITAQVVLATPPPLAEKQGLSLSVGGLQALGGAVDAVRERLFSSLAGREPSISGRFDQDDVRRQLEAGAEHNDARWLVTLLTILGPPYLSVPPESVASGFDELAATGIIQSSGVQWTPEPPLLAYSSQWRNPLPAVAHEVIETTNGAMRRYDHRITIRGDGPLTLVDYQGLLSDQPMVMINSVDAGPYVDGLTRLLQSGANGDVVEWVCVLNPVEVRDLSDTTAVAGSLQPGIWYVLVSEEGAWSRVDDPEGRLDGWVPTAQLHRQSAPAPPNVAP